MKKNSLTILMAFMLTLVITVSAVSCAASVSEQESYKTAASLSEKISQTEDTRMASVATRIPYTDHDLLPTEEALPPPEEKPEPTPFLLAVPEDERECEKSFSAESFGIRMEVTVHGYGSEEFGKDFYVKGDETIRLTVKVTNIGADIRYQKLPTACREITPSHRHELTAYLVGLTDTASLGISDCPEAEDMWALAPGESTEWEFSFFMGKVITTYENPDFFIDQMPYRISRGKNDAYETEFWGYFLFAFDDHGVPGTQNMFEVTVDIHEINTVYFYDPHGIR